MMNVDAALQQTCPVGAVPLYGPFVPSTVPGEKIWVASNGTFVQITRAWATFIRKIGEIAIPVPYGALTESSQFHTSRIPDGFLEQFNMQARKQSTIEIGASIIWHQTSDTFRLAYSTAIVATAGSLVHALPELGPDEHLVVDCHSHGTHAAFFSSTDDKDDGDQVKLAYVVGNCNQETLSFASRLCLRGMFETIPNKSTGNQHE